MNAINNAETIKGLSLQLDTLTAQLRQQIEDLEATGVMNATYYYRDGRYLYVNFNKHGNRVRTYIGTDPDRQKAAIAKIERYRERAALLRQLTELQEQREKLDYEMHWLRSQYQVLTQKLVTPGNNRESRSVTNNEEQTDWINENQILVNMTNHHRW